MLDNVKRRTCEGFKLPEITEKAATTLVCATRAVHEYTSSGTIDGEAVTLTTGNDGNGGDVDITQAAAELKNYREMVVHGLQLMQIEIALHCDRSEAVEKKVDLMSYDLGLLAGIKERREYDTKLWHAVHNEGNGWDPEKIQTVVFPEFRGGAFADPNYKKRTDVLQMSEEDVWLFKLLAAVHSLSMDEAWLRSQKLLLQPRPEGVTHLQSIVVNEVEKAIKADGLSAQGQSVAKAYIWEKTVLSQFPGSAQEMLRADDHVAISLCERLKTGWQEHSDYLSAAAKTAAQNLLGWCRPDDSQTAVVDIGP